LTIFLMYYVLDQDRKVTSSLSLVYAVG